MIFLSRVKTLESRNLGDDGLMEYFGVVQLLDVRFRDPLLLSVFIEDHGTILLAPVRTLAVQRDRIVRHGEEYLEQLSVGYLRRVECDLNRFGMIGFSRAHHFVMCRRRIAARKAGNHFMHPDELFEDRLRAPETPAGEDCCLRSLA